MLATGPRSRCRRLTVDLSDCGVGYRKADSHDGQLGGSMADLHIESLSSTESDYQLQEYQFVFRGTFAQFALLSWAYTFVVTIGVLAAIGGL